MDWSEELQAVHRGLSPQDLEFRELARSSPELLSRETFRKLADEKDFILGTLQPWLTFVGRDKLDELKRVSVGLADLLRYVPERVLGNDPARVLEYYGIGTAENLPLFLARPNGMETAIGRGDFLDTAQGFQCIEFNFTPNLGGWETAVIAGLHLGIPATAAFLDRQKIRPEFTSTGRKLFAHVIENAVARGLCTDGELNVALVLSQELVPDPASPAVAHLHQELQNAFRDLGLPLTGEVLPCHYEDLVAVRNYLFLGKSRVQAVVEFCPDPTPPAVFRSFKLEKLALFNGPIRGILSNKLNLALLSESEATGIYGPEERELIRKHVPWTRRVTRGTTDLRGETVSIPDLLASRRESLVLKKGQSAGGQDVALGWYTSEERWAELVREALDTREWVVQEKLESLPYLYQCGDYGCAPHDMIWGPFVFGKEYGGVILRMQPKAVHGAVNSALGATSGIVFEV